MEPNVTPPPKMQTIDDFDDFEEPPPIDDFDDDIDLVPTPEIKEEPKVEQIEQAVAKVSVKSQEEIKEEFDDDIMDMSTMQHVSNEKEEVYDFGDNSDNLVFYWLDAYETQWTRDGKIYLTGRTKESVIFCNFKNTQDFELCRSGFIEDISFYRTNFDRTYRADL